VSAEARIVLIDELVAQPGQGQALLQAYREHYVPGAQRRGLALQHQLVSPPVWLADQSNTLMFLWTLEGGAKAWWAARIGSGRDPQVESWWHEAQPMLRSRNRRFLGEADDVEGLCHG
jgi:hypothetical protein